MPYALIPYLEDSPGRAHFASPRYHDGDIDGGRATNQPSKQTDR